MGMIINHKKLKDLLSIMEVYGENTEVFFPSWDDKKEYLCEVWQEKITDPTQHYVRLIIKDLPNPDAH